MSDDEATTSFTLISEETLERCARGKTESKIIKTLNQPTLKIMRPEQRASYYTDTKLSMVEYREARRVYENNQEYYLQNPGKYADKLKRLEEWFIRVREPRPEKRKGRLRAGEVKEYREIISEWKKREMAKWKGYSYYALPEARKLVKIDVVVLRQVKAYLREQFQSCAASSSSAASSSM